MSFSALAKDISLSGHEDHRCGLLGRSGPQGKNLSIDGWTRSCRVSAGVTGWLKAVTAQGHPNSSNLSESASHNVERILSWVLAPVLIAAVLVGISAAIRTRPVRRAYEEHFRESRHERLFLAWIGFVVAVAVVRSLTWAIHNGIGPFEDVSLGGRHIHHLVWGILILLLVGLLWTVRAATGADGTRIWVGRLMSLMYGVGSALTLDEFALWLNLRDVYWAREGRESFEALAFFGGLLGIAVFGAGFFRRVVRHLRAQ